MERRSSFSDFKGFPGLGFQLFDACSGGQMFGHRAAEFLDRLADFCPDFLMGLVGLRFAGDPFPAQFLLCLGGAEANSVLPM